MSTHRVTVIHAPGDIRLEERPVPTVEKPTDAVVRTVAACICGSDLWPYRGENDVNGPNPIGHENVGIVEAVGADVKTIKPGDFVIVPFCLSDNTCANCQKGITSACRNGAFLSGAQGEMLRVRQADGSLVATPEEPSDELVPSLLALSDVMATGWHAAVSAGVTEGCTAVVVGDGAVGLSGVLAAVQMGAEKVVAMSRHEPRQKIAREFGATHIIAERGEEGEQQVMDLTDGIGADAVLECVGTGQSMATAFNVARPGSTVGFVGVPHGVELPVSQMFGRNIGLAGGVAPVRTYLPHLLDLVLGGEIEPGKVFDSEMPLEDVAKGYTAMDQRKAIKVLLRP